MGERASRRWVWGAAVTWAAICLAVAGCDAGGGVDAGGATDPADDTAAQDAAGDTAPDGASDAPIADAADTDATPAQPFTPGLNPAGVHDPTQFAPLVDGQDLAIELGGQGLWMVVTAFRTRGIFEGLVTVETELRSGDALVNGLGLAGQTLEREDDGFDYFYDLYLVVDAAALDGSDAQAATWWLRVRDQAGHEAESNLALTLTGGSKVGVPGGTR